MGYHLNRLDEPIFMAGPKLMRTEVGIRHRLEICVTLLLTFTRTFILKKPVQSTLYSIGLLTAGNCLSSEAPSAWTSYKQITGSPKLLFNGQVR